jgi:hypothetical protein
VSYTRWSRSTVLDILRRRGHVSKNRKSWCQRRWRSPVHLYVTTPRIHYLLLNSPLESQTLTDLNDFITPSQACIKPVQQVSVETSRELAPASVSGPLVPSLLSSFKRHVSSRKFASIPAGDTTKSQLTRRHRRSLRDRS